MVQKYEIKPFAHVIISLRIDESLISEDFIGTDTLALKARYDMPIKSEANLWAKTARFLYFCSRNGKKGHK
jgi:hypothetical protein